MNNATLVRIKDKFLSLIRDTCKEILVYNKNSFTDGPSIKYYAKSLYDCIATYAGLNAFCNETEISFEDVMVVTTPVERREIFHSLSKAQSCATEIVKWCDSDDSYNEKVLSTKNIFLNLL